VLPQCLKSSGSPSQYSSTQSRPVQKHRKSAEEIRSEPLPHSVPDWTGMKNGQSALEGTRGACRTRPRERHSNFVAQRSDRSTNSAVYALRGPRRIFIKPIERHFQVNKVPQIRLVLWHGW
jgi:hypothetical protein